MAQQGYNPSQPTYQPAPQQVPAGYPQQTWPQQMPQPAPQPAGIRVPDSKARTFGIAGIAAGVAALVGSPTVVLGILAGIAAIALGYLVWRQQRTFAIGALVAGIAGIVLTVALFATGFSLFGKLVFVPISGNVRESFPDDVSSVHSSVVDELPLSCSDTSYYDFQVTRLEMDEGELVVYYSAYDANTPSSIEMHYEVYCPQETVWTINGVRVEPSLFSTTLQNGETKETWFYFDQEEMEKVGITSVDEIYSLHGEVYIDAYVSGNVAATYHDTIDA